MTTLEAYFAAVESGDAHTLASFFAARPQEEADSERLEREHYRVGAEWEWVRPFDPSASYTGQGTLLQIAIACDHAEVLEWLFSTEAMAAIGATALATVLPFACVAVVRAQALSLIELLLMSAVFERELSLSQQQKLLDRLVQTISIDTRDDIIRLLVAHGA